MGYQRSYDCGTLTIAASAQNSGNLAADPHFQNADALIVAAPSALDGVLKIQVSLDGGSNFIDLTQDGSDVTLGEGNAVIVSPLPFTHLRVSSGITETSERTITVRATETISQIRTRKVR